MIQRTLQTCPIVLAFLAGVLITLSLALAVVYNNSGVFKVVETIEVDAGTLDLNVGPNIAVEKTVHVTNTGLAPTDVIVTAEVLADTGGPYPGVTVTPSTATTVPAGSSLDLVFVITTANGISSGNGTLNLSVIRP